MLYWRISRYLKYVKGNWKLIWSLKSDLGFIRTVKELILTLNRAYSLMKIDYAYYFQYEKSTRNKLSNSLIVVR